MKSLNYSELVGIKNIGLIDYPISLVRATITQVEYYWNINARYKYIYIYVYISIEAR